MEKGFQASLEKFVLLSREEAESLKSKAKGAINLNLHLQENELELRNERKKCKDLEKLLLDAHKRIGELTLKQREKTSDDSNEVPTSASDVSSLQVLTSSVSSLQMDGGPDSTYTSLTSGSSKGGNKATPKLVDQVLMNGKLQQHHVTYPEPRIFKFGTEPPLVSKGTDNSIMKDTSVELMKKDSINRDNSLENVGGVSVQYFNNLKMELLKTKKYLRQVLQEKPTGLGNEEMQMHIQQKMEAMVEELKTTKQDRDSFRDKLESTNRRLSLYKSLVNEQVEGATVHSSSEETSLTGRPFCVRSNSRDLSYMVSDSSCQTSPFLRPQVSANWTEDNSEEKQEEPKTQEVSRVPSPEKLQPVLKDMQNQLHRVQKQLEEQQEMNESLRLENKEVKKNYQQLLNSLQGLERHQEQKELKSKKLQLEDENLHLKKAISEYEEDNNHLLSTIEVIQNNLTKEKDKAMQLEATLREEQRCHGLTKHNLYVMYGNLKTKYDRLAHQKNLLEQRLVSVSEPSRHTNTQSSKEACKSNPEMAIYENVARNLEPETAKSLNPNLHQLPVALFSDPDRIVSVREPVESTYDDDLPQNVSQPPLTASSENQSSQFLCKRCLNEFDVEMEFLCHIEKCLID